MKATDLTRLAFDMAEEALRSRGSVVAMILLHAKGKGVMVMPYKDGSMPVNMQQFLIVRIIQEARRVGTFDGVVMVSETWSAPAPKEELIGVLRPSMDPDRKEGLLAYAYGADGSKDVKLADIKRENGKPIVVPHQADYDSVSSWLDDAFI